MADLVLGCLTQFVCCHWLRRGLADTFRNGLGEKPICRQDIHQAGSGNPDPRWKLKLSVVQKVVEGRDVVMVDDSIIRGTTSQRIVRLLKDAGVKSVHVRICSPPVVYPCYYGIDISSRDELIVAQKTMDEIRQYIGADSLEFLSVEGMVTAISGSVDEHGLCLACFSGQYPTPIAES